MAVNNNAIGGKDPCFGLALGAGKREGMAGTARSNHPGGIKPIDKVRRLQRKLWTAAKRHPGRRFHALYDRICRSDVLAEAWKRVKNNRGTVAYLFVLGAMRSQRVRAEPFDTIEIPVGVFFGEDEDEDEAG